ncbi:MAG: hypothetical protein HYY08_02590 [Firmicutes bacterium]|nr:hypothetical protein [Bacillota bacterium]
MYRVSKEDVLQGLKRCKRLAKQDFLASSLTPNPEFWSAQAGARRKKYDELTQVVEEEGVEAAYGQAKNSYAALPLPGFEPGSSLPEVQGERQALEMFFTIVGLDAHKAGSGVSAGFAHERPPAAGIGVSPQALSFGEGVGSGGTDS